MQIPSTIHLEAEADSDIAAALEEIAKGLRARHLTGIDGTITAEWPDPDDDLLQPGHNPYSRQPSALTVHARITINCTIEGREH